MARRGTLSGSSPSGWRVRAALAIGAAWIGYGSVTQALAYMMRADAIERAHALAPGDGRITALMSASMAGPQATAADRGRADDLARAALRQDPTAVTAVATLGIDAQIRGDTANARRIFVYSDKLSRRDLRTRLWAIEDAVTRNDVPGTLYHYDIALRTSRLAPDSLFPGLASAIADPPIRDALVRTLAARPAWGELFVAYASDNGPDSQATARLFQDLYRHGIQPPDGVTRTLITRLLAEGHSGGAWIYYASTTPGVNRRMSRDPRFSKSMADPSPFDWTPIADSGISATIQRGKDGGIFDFAVPANLGGTLVRQAQMLPPGDYVLEGRSARIDQPDGALPYWTLTCGDEHELGRVDVPGSGQAGGRFAGRFTVPPACPVQQLMLVARPSDQMAGVTGQILQVRLRPAPL